LNLTENEFKNSNFLGKISFDFSSNLRNLQTSIKEKPINPYDKLYGQAENINCIQNVNCFSPNKCIYNNRVCNCSIAYANFFSSRDYDNTINNSTLIYCKYERKRQLTAFCLTIFFNFGLAQFYIENLTSGLIKLAIALVSIIFIPFAVFYKNPLLSMLVGIFFCFIISIWGMVDLILFGINYYDDGNNVPLLPW
jgi:hypothetical protein